MAKFEVIPATRGHIDDMLPHVREADRIEIIRACGLPVRVAMHLSFDTKHDCIAGLVDGEVALVAGVKPRNDDPRIGVPWMIGTEKINDVSLKFLRKSREFIDGVKGQYDHLVNYVDADNAAAVNWLKWLGFNIMEAEPFGVGGYPFHKFEMEVEKNV